MASAPGEPQPRRWLVVQATALLEAVATTNYACYGRGGVPRYPAPAPSRPPEDPATLCVELLVRDQQGGVRLACLDLDLVNRETNAQRMIWGGLDAARHLQVWWVWDFYRILSHVALRAALPESEPAPEPAWQAALDALRAIEPGDTIELRVRSACGDIHQTHTLAARATTWQPARP